MKKHIIIKLILIGLFSSSYANEIYADGENNNIISLGEINSDQELKVYKNNQIIFINQNKLEQIKQYETKKFINLLYKNNLSFKSVEQEKDYTVEIFKNKLYFKQKSGKTQKFNLKMFFDYVNSNWFKLAFKDESNKISGFIIESYDKKDKYKFKMILKLGSDIFETNLSIGERNE